MLLAIAVILYTLFRNKKKRSKNQKYLPGDSLLKRFNRWRQPARGEYSAQLQPNPSVPSLVGRDGRRSRDTSRERSIDPERNHLATLETTERANPATTAAGVDRNTSVRSVMTLPAYTPAARPTEQTIAREGERGGIDTVIEYPEDQADEERRRDEEMESLYQIRRQRRQEQAEREERRRLRREARERGDFEAVRRLQQESRQRAESVSTNAVTSAALIAEHQAATAARDKRVSAVQYAELGVARHDGSKIRGSIDSDNRPLLDSAASISGMSLERPSTHNRDRSGSSVISVSSANGSDDGQFTPPQLDDNGFEIISLEPTRTNGTRSRASSSAAETFHEESDGADLGIRIPTDLPPQYDDPPDYTSPISARPSVRSVGPPRLPSLTSVPSIEVTGAVSPLSATPTSAHTHRTFEVPQRPSPVQR